MNDYSIVELLLMGILILSIMGFTVWFGGWISTNVDEALSHGHKRDEHEENPGI